jgi:RNA polymerase sigma factor (sigma-70 family)
MNVEQNYWGKFLQGDNLALGNLYSEVFEPLVFVSMHYVKNLEVARDIVSDLFVYLITTPFEMRNSKWKSVQHAKAYLSIAVKNKSIDYIRTAKNRAEINLQLPDNSIEIPAYFEAEILSILTSTETEIFQLHLDGFKNQEIAEHQNITEKTVRNKLSLSRKKMGRMLKSILVF